MANATKSKTTTSRRAKSDPLSRIQARARAALSARVELWELIEKHFPYGTRIVVKTESGGEALATVIGMAMTPDHGVLVEIDNPSVTVGKPVDETWSRCAMVFKEARFNSLDAKKERRLVGFYLIIRRDA